WLEFFKMQKRGQLEILQRVQGGRGQSRLERLRKLVVLLKCGVQELKKIISRCAEAAPQSAASVMLGPGLTCRLLAPSSGWGTSAIPVRRDKAALSSGCKSHPATRSSRKQPEQLWR